MSAIIETLIGEENRNDYWIEKKVLRVGRGSDCDVRFENSELSAHVATIRFRNGQYVVYNRGVSPLRISDRSVLPDKSDTWHANEVLEISPNIQLQLLIDGDPTPSAQIDTEVLESYQQKRSEERRLKSVQDTEAQAAADDAESEEPKSERGNRSNGQNAIGVFLLGLAMLGLLGIAAMFAINAYGVKKPVFNPKQVAKSLLGHASELPSKLVLLLQETQQAIEIQDRESAKSRLGRLLAEMERLKAAGDELTISQGDGRVSYEDALRAYINEYLSQLE